MDEAKPLQATMKSNIHLSSVDKYSNAFNK
jgi:hypothetical protein